MNSIFEEIKNRMDILDVVRFYGLEVNRSKMACCPFHNDKTPSLKIYDENYYCFGCGASGDATNFVARLYNISQYKAALKLSYGFGLGLTENNIEMQDNSRLIDRQKHILSNQNVLKIVTDYFKLLQKWQIKYVPKHNEQQLNPKFVESLVQMSRMEYMYDYSE